MSQSFVRVQVSGFRDQFVLAELKRRITAPVFLIPET
jgi:hypothetical protein